MKHLISFLFTAALLICCSISAAADLNNSGGILRYYDENGREAAGIGVDVSYYNNQIDWFALKAEGYDFAIIRLGGRGWGTGSLYGDRLTQTFLREAQAAGMQLGAYFYSTARNPSEALEEAQASLAEINGIALDLPVFIDMELSGDYPAGRSDSLSPSERAAVIETFCEAVSKAGYQAGLYASEGYCRFNLDYQAVTQYPLWLASYTVNDQIPQYIDGFAFWQQSDSAYAGGIDGPFDLDLFFN